MGTPHTYTCGDFRLRHGNPFPFGASIVPGGINFSIYSNYATAATLVLFKRGAAEPFAEIPFIRDFRMGNVVSMVVLDLNPDDIEYGYRVDGPFLPREGHRFDRTKILLDPYAKMLVGVMFGACPIAAMMFIPIALASLSMILIGKAIDRWKFPKKI